MKEWIQWNGGDCPVEPETMVEIMMIDGECWDDEPAGNYNWNIVDEIGEIIAYRVLNLDDPISIKEKEYA